MSVQYNTNNFHVQVLTCLLSNVTGILSPSSLRLADWTDTNMSEYVIENVAMNVS